MASDFKDLRAYQLSRRLSAYVYAAVQEWRHFDQRTVGIQLVRAADSVGANIAEAMGRWHEQDQRRLLLIARRLPQGSGALDPAGAGARADGF